MAILKNNILGIVRGRTGDYIYRLRNGKVVKYRRPINQRVSRSEASETARTNFTKVVKLATCINSLPQLKKIWKSASVPGATHYQKMIRHNSKYAMQVGISVRNIISPPGIPLVIEELSLSSSALSLIVVAKSFKLKKFVSNTAFIHIIFYLYSPRIKNVSAYNIFGLSKEFDLRQGRDKHDIKVATSEIAESINSYGKVIIFVAASMFNEGNEKAYWTSTYAEDIDIRF